MSQQEHTMLRDHNSSAIIAQDRSGYLNRVAMKKKASTDNGRLCELENELLNMKKQIAKLMER